MILADGYEISRRTVSPHKFGGDPMAEYLWVLDGIDADQRTGDIDWGLTVSQFGRRLLCCNSSGFVWVHKHDTIDDATAEFDAIDADYLASEWSDQ